MNKEAEMAKSKVTTPKGELHWVFIDGEGSLNELNDTYEYKATLLLPTDSQECKDLQAKYDKLWEESADKKAYEQAYAEAKPAMQAKMEFHKGYSEVLGDDDKPTGKTQFRFKTGTTYKPKKGEEEGKPVKISVYNAKAKKVNLGDVKIGNGTIGRISGTLSSYFKATNAGVSGYLSSIQIINLVEYVDNEFEEEEGYVGPDEDENEFTGQADVPDVDTDEAPEGV
jgi:hypothetical protein